MQNDFIARYIYAVTRYLPEKTRADVEKELDGLISDMLEERCTGKTPTEADIKAVLTELGTPEELAAKYSGDENKALISGAYLLLYRRIVKLVLPIAAAGLALAGLLSVFLDWNPGPDSYQYIGQTIGTVIGGAFAGAFEAFGFITIIFAIMERKKVVLKTEDMFSKLPPVPTKRAQIKTAQPIISIMWAIFGAVLLIGFPWVLGSWSQSTGWVPVFNTEVLRSFWPLILFWAALAISKDIVKLIDGRYSVRLAIVTAVTNILTMITLPIVFLNQNLMNPNFASNIGQFVHGEGVTFVFWPLQNFNVFLVTIVIFALVLETAVTAARALRRNI